MVSAVQCPGFSGLAFSSYQVSKLATWGATFYCAAPDRLAGRKGPASQLYYLKGGLQKTQSSSVQSNFFNYVYCN